MDKLRSFAVFIDGRLYASVITTNDVLNAKDALTNFIKEVGFKQASKLQVDKTKEEALGKFVWDGAPKQTIKAVLIRHSYTM